MIIHNYKNLATTVAHSLITLCIIQTGIGAITTKATTFAPTLLPPQNFLAGSLASFIAASTYNLARHTFSTRLSKLDDWEELSARILFVVGGILLSSFLTPWLAHHLLGHQITRIAAAALSAVSLTLPFIGTQNSRLKLFLGTSLAAPAISALAAHAMRFISAAFAPSRTAAALAGFIGAAVFSAPFSQVDRASNRNYRSMLATVSLAISICATTFLTPPLALNIGKPIAPLASAAFGAWLPLALVLQLYSRTSP